MERDTQVRLAFAGAAILAATLSGCANVGTTPAANSQWRSFRASDGAEIHYRYWAGPASPGAVVQIVHGAAEHSGRYDRFANALVSEGYAVYATDHRGHGRTRVRSGQLGDAGPDAWNRFIEDEQQLSQLIRQANPGAKLVLFGHSLGSFIAQDYITRRPDLIDALILSGTAYRPPPPPQLIAALDVAARAAPLGPSEFWANLFKDFNKPFSNQLVRDILQGFTVLRDPAREALIPKSLSVLVIQGSVDPVGENLKGTQALLDRYQALGLTRVSHKFYDGARHEVLKKTTRDEVPRDGLNWLKAVV